MTRIESGGAALRMEWQSLEELIGAALAALDDRLIGHPVVVVIPPDLPLVALDGQLVTQVVTHLVENALTYTPPATPICIRARLVPDRQALPTNGAEPVSVGSGPAVQIEVADAGPGLPPGTEQRVFEKFYRGPAAAPRGVGLGLAICRGIISAHGGAIWAERGSAGGTVFRFWLPFTGVPPLVQPEDMTAPRDGYVWRKAG
jgi:two-component system sensor histidine kinase KdpD